MRKRGHISNETKLAAALLTIVRPNEAGEMVPVIPYEESKRMTAKQIISRFRFDHYPIRHEAGGPDKPWNLTPLPTKEHEIKTAKVDIPQAAKIKRLAPEVEEFRRKVLAKPCGHKRKPTGRWPSRPMRRRK